MIVPKSAKDDYDKKRKALELVNNPLMRSMYAGSTPIKGIDDLINGDL